MTYTRSSLYAYTYKEGVLSRVAHDLRIALPGFAVAATGDSVDISFDLTLARPEGAMVSGRLAANELDAKDLSEISRTIQGEVLHTKRFPRARFVGAIERSGAKMIVRGKLELHGKERELAFEARLEGERLVGEFELQPSDFGITPYRALLGALRLQDRVRIAFSLDPTELAQP